MANLYDRTKGALPLSIGTSMALESVFLRAEPHYDPSRKPPVEINIGDYQYCIINLYSMIRNLAGSVDRMTYIESQARHVAEILNTEIEVIRSIFQQEGHNLCQPVFIHPTYRSLESTKKGLIQLREPTTLIQRSYDLKAEQTLKILAKTPGILEVDTDIDLGKTAHNAKVLIITHLPHDLLSYKHFRQMDLLESHTGALKPRVKWSTKYANLGKDDLTHLPFNEHLLFIFGDAHQIQPQPYRLRKMVYDLSVKKKWTVTTTVDKIKSDYRYENLHPADLQILLRF